MARRLAPSAAAGEPLTTAAKGHLRAIDFRMTFLKRLSRNWILLAAFFAATLTLSGCGNPDAQGLRQSFAQQLAANPFIRDFQHNGDDIIFFGPGPDGILTQWRVHIDSAVVEPNAAPQQPYRGTVKSSWRANGRLFQPRGRDSNLPLELTSTGLAQDCWALWDKVNRKWSWE